jgi:hypothetical protein
VEAVAAAVVAEVEGGSAAMAVLDGTETLQLPDDAPVNKATLLHRSSHISSPL